MIYAVSLMIQEKEVTAYCFGSCGKILIGGIDMGEYGPFVPCKKEACPHEDKTTPVIGQVDDIDVCIRKLKQLM